MATFPKCKVAEGQLTTAQVNANSGAGTVIVPAVAGRTLTVVDCWLRAIGGAAGGATAVVLEDTAGTDAVSYVVAALTENVVARAGCSNSTATGLGTALGKSKGLRIARTVSDLTTATAIDYMVLYKVDSD